MASFSSASNGDKSKGSAKRVAVVGAGVCGLAAAYRLKSNGVDVTVFEADARVGGKLRSVSRDGLIWDEGANTMTESEPVVRSLLDELGLREKQQFPISQFKRYVVRNGMPVLIYLLDCKHIICHFCDQLPSNPIVLLTSNFLSSRSKFKIILEPLLWEKRNPSKVSDDMQESVGHFFERHFGSEVVDYLIDPFVAGTSGGDPDSLSISHSFPELWNIEKRFGSIITGAIQSALSSRREKHGKPNDSPKKRKAQRGSFSFYGGMQTLPNAMYEKLGKDRVKLQSKVLSLSYDYHGNPASESWSLVHHSEQNKRLEEPPFDALVLTAPLCNVKELIVTKTGNRFPLDFIPEVDYLPLSVIITTFRKQNVKRPLEGFGVLVPSKEQKNGVKTLGTLFSSMMFPDRAPSDLYLYTTFIGGSRNRELAKAPKDELKQVVTADIRQLLGAEGEPTSVNHYYWSKAFPLYGRNYDAVLRGIEKMERDLPGLFYAGNNRDGLSVGKAIASGCKAADLAISYLNSCSDIKDSCGD